MKQIATFLFALLFGTLFATEADRRQIRSLTEQGLHEAAEAFCIEKFQQPDISDTDKILLAAELAWTYSQQLLLVEPAQRSRIVRRIETLESTWLTAPAASALPDLVLAKIILRLQIAMAYRSLGDYQRLEADTASETRKNAAYQQTRSTLQDALDRLKKCQQELQAFRQRIGINADSSLNQRMLALECSLTMQRGITQKSLALTFSTEGDRNFELQQAAETLSALASRNSTEPVIVRCKIEKAACHRLAGELDRCAEILTQLLNAAASLAPECLLHTEAEWIRYNIAAGNVVEMRRRYAANRPNVQLYLDFDLARLEMFLVSDPARNIRPEMTAAARLQDTMGRELGNYWGRRARMTVSAMTLGSTELISAEILATLAENQYRENQFAESADYYEQAATKADANRQADAMFQYNRLAAHAWAKAMEQVPEEEKAEYRLRLIPLLRKLVEQSPNHPEAFNLHFDAIKLQVLIVSAQPEALDDYLALVQEHVGYWEDSPHLQDIRRLSVIFLERQSRLGEAMALLPLLDEEHWETLPPAIRRLHVRQLDSEGKTQEAVDILKVLLKQRREPATVQLFAAILSRQSDADSLKLALDFWTELERCVTRNTEEWWSAREGIIDVLFKLDRRDDAKRSFEILRISYPELGGAERKERLTKRFE